MRISLRENYFRVFEEALSTSSSTDSLGIGALSIGEKKLKVMWTKFPRNLKKSSTQKGLFAKMYTETAKADAESHTRKQEKRLKKKI